MFDAFPLTRDAALTRWRGFLPRVTEYGARRNFVSHAPQQHVSGLSPAIRLGLIRPEEIVGDTLRHHDFKGAEKWLQEVCWRSYWKGWLEMRPQVWRAWRQRLRELRQTLPDTVMQRARDVSEGRSGVAVMDRLATELRVTGYLHNHARMWWASFWIHVERLPWELGAEFFFQHLLDADPASNTLSWRWVAGLQTAGKTYLVRRSNLERFCDATLLDDTRGLERLEDDQVSACLQTDDTDLSRQPLADVPTEAPTLSGRIGVWIHADDLCLESSPLASLQPSSVAAFTCQAAYAHHGLSARRIAALHTAMADGVERAGAHWRCPALLSESPTAAEGLRHWIQSEGVQVVVAMAPHVGPVADALPGIQRMLGELKVPMHLVRRPWDTKLFPLAGAGFFPFWEKTSRELRAPDSTQPSLR